MDIIYFFYGLAFVVMGIVIYTQPKKGSGFKLARGLWLLAGFGIIHGAREFFEMWTIIKQIKSPVWHAVEWVCLVVSYAFLLEAGRKFAEIAVPACANWQRRFFALPVGWLLTAAAAPIIMLSSLSSDFWATADILTRYFVGLPGSLLTGVGLLAYYRLEEPVLRPLGVRRFFLLSGLGFIIYGILGGVFVSRGRFFPSNWLNGDTFRAIVGIPPQLFRALCALTISWGIIGMLKIFDWEMKEKVDSTLMENLPDSIFHISLEGKFISMNQSACSFYGLASPLEITGEDAALYVAENRDGMQAAIQRAAAGETVSLEYVSAGKTGNEAQWNAIVSAVKGSDGAVKSILVVSRDITERKRAEEAIFLAKNDWEDTFDSITDMITIHDKDFNIVRANKAAERILGLPVLDKIPGGKCFRYYHGTENPPKDCPSCTCLTTRQPLCFELFEPHLKRHLEIWAIPRFDRNQQLIGLIHVVRDITERKRTAESHTRLATAVEQSAEAIMITDTSATISYVNPAFEKITGYTHEEAVGQNPSILKGGQQDAAFYRDLWETLLSGNVWHGRFVNRKKNGALYTEEATISAVRDAAGVITNYVAVKRDITEDLNLQAQLTQAQKMESVGRLAGGVAHDFNNILQVILGNAQLAVEQAGPGDPVSLDLEEIQGAAQRAADLTRQLLAFASKQVITPRTLDFNETVEGMLKMLRRLIGENIELVLTPRAGLWPIRMDPSQVDQILVNLCVNARDAIDGVGTVHIATDNVHVDEFQSARHEEFLPGDYVVLLVSDTGGGMDKETQARIFEPFFTTKAVGKGSGLGLATVFGIVRQNHGHIGVYSEPGKGTTFRIHLPRYLGADAAQPAEGPAKPAARGCETVLLVEDDAAILNMSGRMLQGLGYTVLAAATPEAALRMAEEHAGEIQLVMTDVVMPGMDGRELVERLKGRRPDLKCLFMSGFTADVISTGKDVQFIQKPFSMEDLAVKLREALAEAK